jgi:hypothetical protein
VKKQMAILVRKTPVRFTPKTGWEYETERIDVEIMAQVKGYAMVRRKGCVPFVASLKELEFPHA